MAEGPHRSLALDFNAAAAAAEWSPWVWEEGAVDADWRRIKPWPCLAHYDSVATAAGQTGIVPVRALPDLLESGFAIIANSEQGNV